MKLKKLHTKGEIYFNGDNCTITEGNGVFYVYKYENGNAFPYSKISIYPNGIEKVVYEEEGHEKRHETPNVGTPNDYLVEEETEVSAQDILDYLKSININNIVHEIQYDVDRLTDSYTKIGLIEYGIIKGIRKTISVIEDYLTKHS